MKAFICVGVSIIMTLIIIGIWSSHCHECCNGNPCDPVLYGKKLRGELP